MKISFLSLLRELCNSILNKDTDPLIGQPTFLQALGDGKYLVGIERDRGSLEGYSVVYVVKVK